MYNSGKKSTAIFLAATLVAGIFALISPSFIDVEASGDKRDNKHKDNRHDSSKGSSVNVKFICNNINVGGVNIDVNPRDIVSSLAGAQAQEEGNQEVSANSMGNNERNHDSIKQHNGKDFTFICVQNNNVPPVVLSDCEKCFITTDEGGFLPPGQKTNLEEYLDEELEGLTLAEFCEMVTDGEFSDAEIRLIVENALPGNQQLLEEQLSDCLIDSIEEENDLT